MEMCPVCGAATMHTRGTALEGSDTKPAGELVGYHTDPDGRSCWAAGYSVDYARDVGRIREREPGLTVRAHP